MFANIRPVDATEARGIFARPATYQPLQLSEPATLDGPIPGMYGSVSNVNWPGLVNAGNTLINNGVGAGSIRQEQPTGSTTTTTRTTLPVGTRTDETPTPSTSTSGSTGTSTGDNGQSNTGDPILQAILDSLNGNSSGSGYTYPAGAVPTPTGTVGPGVASRGPNPLAIIVLVILAVGGYYFWKHYQGKIAAKEGA